MKKILITGASSQIGDFLMPMLQQQNTDLVAISRKKKQDSEITWVQAHIDHPETLASQLPQADILIHIAPLALLPPILDTMQKKGVKRVIAFGTTSMFAKKNSHTKKEQSMVTELEYAEHAIHNFCHKNNIHWTIFRPTLIYGCGKDKNISFIAKTMRKYHCFPIVGKALGLRQPVHSQDLAQACLQALNNSNSFNKAYNLSGHEILTYKKMLQRIMQVEQLDVPLFSISLNVFRTLVKIANIFPKYRYLTPDMANRMNQNLCFDHQQASEDFGYNPRSFQPPKV